MSQLKDFIHILSGRFNNAQQFHLLQEQGVTDFPLQQQDFGPA